MGVAFHYLSHEPRTRPGVEFASRTVLRFGVGLLGARITATAEEVFAAAERLGYVPNVLASELAPGDSGAAVVDTDGHVVGVAFAISPDNAETAYALSTSELRTVLEAERQSPAPTGPCLR